MATSNKTFNATVVGVVDIKQGDSTRILQGLLDIQKKLTDGFKVTANEARNAFDQMAARPGDKAALETYTKALRDMQQELKQIATYKGGVNAVKDTDIQKAAQLLTQMNQLARVAQDMQKQKGIETGSFGMDARTAKEAIQRLQELGKAALAVNAAMTMKGDADGSLTKYKQKIEANTQALVKHIDALRNTMAMEEAHSKALIANAARDAGIAAARRKMNEDQALAQRKQEMAIQALNLKGTEDAERQKNLALKKAQEERQQMAEQAALRANQLLGRQAADRKKMEDDEALRQNLNAKRQAEMQYKLLNSASAQSQAARQGLDLSATGRAASAYQFQQLSDRTSLLANPAFQAQDAARRQRQNEEAALKAIYAQANVRPEVSGMYKMSAADTGNAARVQAAQSIVALQRQLVDLQQKGQLTDSESLKIRQQISQAIANEVQARNKAGNQQAQQNQAERNMARVGGIGGASLLAVQASLMANYSILNGVTGSIKSAVTNSVELEAAFRNVQAVTNTTKTEMTGLETKIKEVAAASKFTSVEVAGAALILGQAGLSAKQVGESIQAVTMLASAAGTNIAQAVDLVTSVIGVFDKKAGDTADIANKITAAANSSKVSVEKLALGFQYAGNTAALMGVSFEETTAAMSAMSNAGIKSGSTMGTGLRQFLVETQKPSEEFMATISRIGLSMADLDFKSNGLIGVARKLRDAGFIASDAIKSFDVRGAAAFNAMIANPEELERQYSLLLNTRAGIKANETQMDSLKSQSARLTTSLTNLAMAGFEPLGKLLTIIADKMATAVQFMSEYKTAAALLGSLIAGTLVSAMALHTASLAAGALALLNINAASLVALRGLTVLGAGQAILTGMSTAFVALRSAAAAAAAAYTISASAGTVASGLWAAATTGLTAGIRALTAALGGLTMITGIGLAVAAAAAAYYLWNSASASSRDEMDKLKAKSEEANGAFKDKQGIVESLTNKINDLTYKQQEAKVSTQDLTTTGMTLASQFGAIGYAADSTTNSYGGMIKKLKELRGEMQLVAQAKLQEAIRENKTLQVKATGVAQDKLGAVQDNALRDINTATTQYKDQLTPAQLKKLLSAKKELEANDASKAVSVADAGDILKDLATVLWGKSGKAKGDAVDFTRTAKGIDTFASANVERMSTASEGQGLALTQRNYADGISYNQKPFQVGNKSMTLEQVKDTLGGNMRGKVPTTGDKLADYDKFYDVSQKEMAQLGEVLDALEKDRNNPNGNKDVINDNIRDIRGKIEGVKTEVQKYAKETQAKADRAYKNDQMRLKAVAGSKNKAISAEAIRDLAALDKKYKTRGIIDPDEKFNAEQAIEETGDIRAGNKLSSKDRTNTRDIGSQVRERVFKLQEAELLRQADTLKGDAVLSGDANVSEDLMKKGIQKVKEAGDKAIAAAREKQSRDLALAQPEERDDLKKSFATEIATIRATFAERAKQFVTSFKGFFGAAAETLKMLEAKINEQKAGIDAQKIAGEDRVYEQSAGLRDIQLEQALGKKTKDKSSSSTTKYGYKTGDQSDGSKTTTVIGPKSVAVSAESFGGGDTIGSGTSSSKSNGKYPTTSGTAGGAVTGTLKQRLSKEIIRVAQIELEENEKFLDLLGDSDAGLIGSLTQQLKLATDTYKLNSDKLAELQALQKANGGALTEDQRQQMQELSTALPAQQGAVKDAQSALRGAVSDRRAARKDNADIQVKIAENTQVLPQEVSIKNITNALDQAWNKWKDVVGDMDVVKVLGDGMQSVLGTLTGSLGNAFASIADGTKSVKSAFRDMATGVIKAMLDIVAQALAMQAVKGIMSFIPGMGSLFGGGAGAGAAAATPSFSLAVPMATGGFINSLGKLEPVQMFANGGPVRGGVQGRDSVPARVMPGEFIMKRSAVDAVGTDYLHSLNQSTNKVVSSSTAATPEANAQPSVVNVWVVSPDQKPGSMGPKDVIATISDDINRGGSIKKLIKSVVTNQV